MGTSYSSNTTTNTTNDITVTPITTVTTNFDELANALTSISNETLAQNKITQAQQGLIQIEALKQSKSISETNQTNSLKWQKIITFAIAGFLIIKYMKG